VEWDTIPQMNKKEIIKEMIKMWPDQQQELKT